MQFANQAISLFISGIFCLVWMGILAWPLDNYLAYGFLKEINIKDFGPIALIAFTFIVFPLAYAVGNAVNAIVNRLFGKMDKEIRCNMFKERFGWSEIAAHISEIGIKTSLNEENYEKLTCKSKGQNREQAQPENSSGNDQDLSKDLLKIITSIYHHFRYGIYNSGAEFYGYLVFHREIIRILRATCFNFLLIFLSLLTVSECWLFKIIGYAVIAFVLINTLCSENRPLLDIFRYLFSNPNTKKAYFWALFIFGNALLFWKYPIRNQLFLYLFPLVLFISFICFIAWEKQQKNFYQTIIGAQNAMKKGIGTSRKD